jgi:hypothetical protein
MGIFQQIAPTLNRRIYCLLERRIQQEKRVPQLKEPCLLLFVFLPLQPIVVVFSQPGSGL